MANNNTATSNRGYSAKITESNKPLTTRERINVEMLAGVIRIDSATKDGNLMLHPDKFGTMAIHNERSEDKDYTTHFIIDKAGNIYTTGSPSLYESLTNICKAMAEEVPEEDFEIEIIRLPSKKREGKDFLSCRLA